MGTFGTNTGALTQGHKKIQADSGDFEWNTASCQCEVLQHKTAVKGMAECANQHYYILLCIKKQIQEGILRYKT